MKNTLKDELQNHKWLNALRDHALQSRLASEHSPDFHALYAKHRRRLLYKTLVLYTSIAASVAGVLFVVFSQMNATKSLKEMHYIRHHSEWIAISDEAILTHEYIKLYNQYHQTLDNDLIWQVSE